MIDWLVVLIFQYRASVALQSDNGSSTHEGFPRLRDDSQSKNCAYSRQQRLHPFVSNPLEGRPGNNLFVQLFLLDPFGCIADAILSIISRGPLYSMPLVVAGGSEPTKQISRARKGLARAMRDTYALTIN